MKRLGQLAITVVWVCGVVAGSSLSAGAQPRTDCSDFAYQEDAQATFDQDRSDPHNLDGDNDGVACQNLPRRSAAAAQVQPTTSTTVATTSTTVVPTPTTAQPLADTGIEEDAYLVGAGLVLGGLMLVAVSHRVHPSPASPWDILRG